MAWRTTEGGLREYLRHFDSEDLVCYYSFWDTCVRCASLNTHEVHVSHPSSGVEVIRKCDNCGKEWMTKVIEYDEGVDQEDEECYEDEEYQRCQCPFCACAMPTRDFICAECLAGCHQG